MKFFVKFQKNENILKLIKELNDTIIDHENYLIKPLLKMDLNKNGSSYWDNFFQLFCLY